MIRHQSVESKRKLMAAVRELRTLLRLTQTEFGRWLNKSLPTINRWETVRPPNDEGLLQLERLAIDHGHHRLAEVFRNAVVAVPTHKTFELDAQARSGREKFYVATLLLDMREAEKQRVNGIPEGAAGSIERIQQFERIFAPVMEAYGRAIQEFESKRMKGGWGDFFKMAEEYGGRSDEEVARAMKQGMTNLPPSILRRKRRECEGCSNICEPGIEVCPKCGIKLSPRSLPVVEPPITGARYIDPPESIKKGGRKK